MLAGPLSSSQKPGKQFVQREVSALSHVSADWQFSTGVQLVHVLAVPESSSHVPSAQSLQRDVVSLVQVRDDWH
jgi:hypothetical protein